MKVTALSQRIRDIRKQKGLTLNELGKKIGVSYAQLSRYEIQDSQPPAEVLRKLANALDTSVDYLLSGNKEEKAKASLKDVEVMRHFKDVDQLPEGEKNTLLKVISAYIRDFKARQTYVMA